MIIDFTHSFKDYDEILNFYGIWEYECPVQECHAGMHPLRRHAKYSRSLILWDAGSGRLKEERMEILRLKCSSCGTTHAVLTMDMIPFFVYSIQAFLALLAMCMEPEGSVLRTEEKTGVSYQLLYRFLLIFHEYREQLSFFLRLETLWEAPSHPLDRQLLPMLQVLPPPWPGARFFARLHLPLFLHRRSTVAYPLVSGAFLKEAGHTHIASAWLSGRLPATMGVSDKHAGHPAGKGGKTYGKRGRKRTGRRGKGAGCGTL